MTDDTFTDPDDPTADQFEEEPGEGDAATFESASPADDAPRATDDPGVAVPKATYCETCPHFADPPTVACTHEGTEIAELVGRDHFRVVNCPVVEERAELED